MEREIHDFISYLHETKKSSSNTEISYERDLRKMARFLEDRGIREAKAVRELDLEGYLDYMERGEFASSTISRSVASIRAFFQYQMKVNGMEKDPSDNLRPPKVEKKMPEILSIQEVDLLLLQGDGGGAVEHHVFELNSVNGLDHGIIPPWNCTPQSLRTRPRS